MIALSAMVAGIAAAGAVAALRGAGDRRARLYLMASFGLLSAIVSVPLVIAFARPLYVFHMPAVLPVLLALSVTIHRYANARTGIAEPPLAGWRDGVLPGAGLIVTLGYWSLPAGAKDTLFVEGVLPPGFLPSALVLMTIGLILIWCLASLGYLIATVRALGAYRRRLKALYSNTEQYELRWIDGFLTLLVTLWAAAALSLISDNFSPRLLFPGELVLLLAASVLLFLIAFALASEPVGDTALTVDGGGTEIPPKDKYTRSALTPDRAERIADRIETAMRRDALYLDPALSLQKLSRHVQTPQNLVSQSLNECLGTTFYDYVARWRIEAAKPLIEAGEASILTIALEVGFNSRSTFYKAFKRETGLTPKAFQERRRDINR